VRIAFVTPEFITEEIFAGGLANYLYRVSLGLIELGHEPHIFVSSKKNEKFNFENIVVHRVKVLPTESKIFKGLSYLSLRKFNGTLSWLFMSYKLNKALKKANFKNNYDIIQYSNYTATAFFRIKNIPAVVRLSSFEPLHQQASGIYKPNLDERARQLVEKISLKKADKIFGPSINIARAVEKALRKKVTIIESPFIFAKKKFNREIFTKVLKGKKYFLYWGKINTYKGIDTIASAINEILKTYKDFYFVFVGYDDHKMETIYKNALNNKNRVIHIDSIRHDQLFSIIENAHLAILPSRYDNFPNTCIEGMALKKVIIGTKGTSFEQLITDGENGFLFTPDDPNDLIKTLRRVMSISDEKLRKIGEAAYKRVLLLEPRIVVKQLVDFYKKTINEYKK